MSYTFNILLRPVAFSFVVYFPILSLSLEPCTFLCVNAVQWLFDHMRALNHLTFRVVMLLWVSVMQRSVEVHSSFILSSIRSSFVSISVVHCCFVLCVSTIV